MLALTRRVGEFVVIGDGPLEVRVEIVAVYGDKVRLGFDAPREVSIDREEIRQEKRRELAKGGSHG